MTQLSDFAANQPKPAPGPVPRHCPGCGHDLHSAGKCAGRGTPIPCPCERNMAVSLDITPPESLTEKLARLETDNARLAARATEAEKAFTDLMLRRGQERRDQLKYVDADGRDTRNPHDVLASVAQLGEEQLAQLRHILKALQTAAESRNVVEIDSNGSAGKIKVRVRCTGETLEDAHATALEQFARAMAEVEAGTTAGWQATVDALTAQKAVA